MRECILTALAFFYFYSAHAQTSLPLVEMIAHTPISAQYGAERGAIDYRVSGISVFNNVSGIWELTDSASYTYTGTRGSDVLNNITLADTAIEYSWDGFIYTQEWMTVQHFNANDEVIERITLEFDGAVWTPVSRTLFTYTSDGEIETDTRQTYNMGTWESDYRFVYTYSAGKQETWNHQVWDGTAWENVSRTVYTYSGNDLATTLDQDWNGSSFDNSFRNSYTYVGGNEVERIGETWNGTGWENYRRTTSQYDTDGWLTVSATQHWNSIASSWEDGWRTLYTHNTGDLFYSEIINQNIQGGSWENTSKTENIYNAQNKLAEQISYNWDGTIWMGSFKAKVYYEQYNDGTFTSEPADEIGISVYPNPAADHVLFKSEDLDEEMVIKIYNLHGQLVKSTKATGSFTLYTHGRFPAGMYNYVITVGEEHQQGQLIIQ